MGKLDLRNSWKSSDLTSIYRFTAGKTRVVKVRARGDEKVKYDEESRGDFEEEGDA